MTARAAVRAKCPAVVRGIAERGLIPYSAAFSGLGDSDSRLGEDVPMALSGIDVVSILATKLLCEMIDNRVKLESRDMGQGVGILVWRLVSSAGAMIGVL